MPPTERLYWLDPYQRAFESRIVRHSRQSGQPSVVLEATCFYPTSGGQPHDTGTLNGVPVQEVIEEGDEIIHVLAEALDQDHVQGSIDWPRRLDHMQQHAGQHILSAACERQLGAGTVSFHLGASECIIDVDWPSLTPDQAAAIEDLANQVVMDNRAIRTGQYDQESLGTVALRKPPQVQGLVRVVSVDEFDHSACGGTHPASTGEVGVIHIDRWENRRGGTRITFLCGMRAVRAFRRQSRICHDLAARSSVAIEELPEAVERLNTSLDETRRQLARTRAHWLDDTAATLATQAQVVGQWRIVGSIVEHVEAGELRYLVQRLCEAPDMAVILGVREPAPQLCMARSQNIPVDMNALLRELAGPFGARGGGQAHLAQGGGLSVEQLEGMMKAAVEHLKGVAQGTGPETRLA